MKFRGGECRSSPLPASRHSPAWKFLLSLQNAFRKHCEILLITCALQSRIAEAFPNMVPTLHGIWPRRFGTEDLCKDPSGALAPSLPRQVVFVRHTLRTSLGLRRPGLPAFDKKRSPSQRRTFGGYLSAADGDPARSCLFIDTLTSAQSQGPRNRDPATFYARCGWG